MKNLFIALLLIVFSGHVFGQSTKKMIKQIQELYPGATIKTLECEGDFKSCFEIMVSHPIDHDDPSLGTFPHRLFLYHKSRKAPTVFVTTGYFAFPTPYELTKMTNANQIILEYRFFGPSSPETIDWTYMTNTQAMEDLHDVRMKFGKIYNKRPWLATGISKGGTTTLTYKTTYPDDVDAHVAYVAPIALAQEDIRTDLHQERTGSEACRAQIIGMQRKLLERSDAMTSRLEEWAQEAKMTFSIGYRAAFEYSVLEYPFSFWQYAHPCEEIPDTSAITDDELFTFISEKVGFDYYSDQVYEVFKPAFYQFMTENGYYGYPTGYVGDLLQAVKEPTNRIFAPRDVDLTFRPELMNKVADYTTNKANKVMYIYGEYDTWTACGIKPNEDLDALRIDLEKGGHDTRISSFPEEYQDRAVAKLQSWLGKKVKVKAPYQIEGF